MSSASVLVKSDLASMLLVLPERGAVEWTAHEEVDPALGGIEQARAMRARAGEAAEWVASQPSVRRRLRLAVLDVDDALCVWLKSASLAGPVLHAAFRGACEDWGEEGAAYTPEPLVAGAGSKRSRSGGRAGDDEDAVPAASNACSVVGLRDPLIRLWLDGLDQRGLHPECVMTLWHAMAHAWGGNQRGTSATVLSAGMNRLIWAWHDGADLLAAGVASAGETYAEEPEHHADAPLAASRISLDWLTWAAQIGRAPERVRVIGRDAGSIEAALSKAWGGDPEWVSETLDDPIEETIRRAGRSPSVDAVRDGRHRLSRLESRPTRATRRRHQVLGAALTLAALACVSLGARLLEAREEMASDRFAQRNAMTERIRQTWASATLPPGVDPVAKARELWAEERNRPGFAPPPPVRPILAEANRLADALLRPFESDEGVEGETLAEGETPSPPTELTLLHLDADQQSMVKVNVDDRRETNELTQRLRNGAFAIDWTQSGGMRVNPLSPEYVGQWK